MRKGALILHIAGGAASGAPFFVGTIEHRLLLSVHAAGDPVQAKEPVPLVHLFLQERVLLPELLSHILHSGLIAEKTDHTTNTSLANKRPLK